MPSSDKSLTEPQSSRRVPHIRTQDLTRAYHRGSETIHALKDLDVAIPRGAFAVVFGPSGSGKSTLLNLIGGIDRPDKGEVWVDDVRFNDLSEVELDRFRRNHIGIVFQFNNLLPNLDAKENVGLALVAQGEPWKSAIASATLQLERLGLGDRLSHRPAELSGGEQQRVAFARAVVAEPTLVLADEPTGDLDLESATDVLDLMIALNQDLGVTFVVATHNQMLRSKASHIIELYDGGLRQT
ncbi:MAG: ABC transporter ATP-binding protein [Anaerolineales bacterium]